MENCDIEEIQRRIDEGIRLAQQRLVQQAKHDNFSLVVMRDGELLELKAHEISPSPNGNRTNTHK